MRCSRTEKAHDLLRSRRSTIVYVPHKYVSIALQTVLQKGTEHPYNRPDYQRERNAKKSFIVAGTPFLKRFGNAKAKSSKSQILSCAKISVFISYSILISNCNPTSASKNSAELAKASTISIGPAPVDSLYQFSGSLFFSSFYSLFNLNYRTPRPVGRG